MHSPGNGRAFTIVSVALQPFKPNICPVGPAPGVPNRICAGCSSAMPFATVGTSGGCRLHLRIDCCPYPGWY